MTAYSDDGGLEVARIRLGYDNVKSLLVESIPEASTSGGAEKFKPEYRLGFTIYSIYVSHRSLTLIILPTSLHRLQHSAHYNGTSEIVSGM